MSASVSQRYVGPAITRAISVWGLLVLLVVLLVAFSLLRPDTFPTFFNIRSILNNKSVQALLALAVFIPMTANHFDLSAGFNLGISQVLAIGLQGQGLPWWVAVAAVLVMGAAVGLANGVLVTRVRSIPSSQRSAPAPCSTASTPGIRAANRFSRIFLRRF
jgi:ribose transport system permease protein